MARRKAEHASESSSPPRFNSTGTLFSDAHEEIALIKASFNVPSFPDDKIANITKLKHKESGINFGILADAGGHLLLWLGLMEARLEWPDAQLGDLVCLRSVLSSKREDGFLVTFGKEVGWVTSEDTDACTKVLATIGTNYFATPQLRIDQRRVFRRLIGTILEEVRSLAKKKIYVPIPTPTSCAPFPSSEQILKTSRSLQNRTLMARISHHLSQHPPRPFPQMDKDMEQTCKCRDTKVFDVLEQQGDVWLYKLVHGVMLDTASDWETSEYLTINRFFTSNVFFACLVPFIGKKYSDITPPYSTGSTIETMAKGAANLVEALVGGMVEDGCEDEIKEWVEETFAPLIIVCRGILRNERVQLRLNRSSLKRSHPEEKTIQHSKKRRYEEPSSSTMSEVSRKKAKVTQAPTPIPSFMFDARWTGPSPYVQLQPRNSRSSWLPRVENTLTSAVARHTNVPRFAQYMPSQGSRS